MFMDTDRAVALILLVSLGFLVAVRRGFKGMIGGS